MSSSAPEPVAPPFSLKIQLTAASLTPAAGKRQHWGRVCLRETSACFRHWSCCQLYVDTFTLIIFAFHGHSLPRAWQQTETINSPVELLRQGQDRLSPLLCPIPPLLVCVSQWTILQAENDLAKCIGRNPGEHAVPSPNLSPDLEQTWADLILSPRLFFSDWETCCPGPEGSFSLGFWLSIIPRTLRLKVSGVNWTATCTLQWV